MTALAHGRALLKFVPLPPSGREPAAFHDGAATRAGVFNTKRRARMLVLSRLVGERCRMTVPGSWMKNGEPLVLEVMLASIRGANKARLAFDAPRDVEVERIDGSAGDGIPNVSVSP